MWIETLFTAQRTDFSQERRKLYHKLIIARQELETKTRQKNVIENNSNVVNSHPLALASSQSTLQSGDSKQGVSNSSSAEIVTSVAMQV